MVTAEHVRSDRRPLNTGDRLRHLHRRAALPLIALAGLTFILTVISVGTGPAMIDFATVARILGQHLIGVPAEATWSHTSDTIVWITRLPRVVMAVGAGATLAMAGAALQALVRNPLADPYLLGINSGASTGAATAIVLFAGSGAGVGLLSGSAFAGAAVATLMVLAIGGGSAASGPLRLVMAGMAVGYAFSAATSFLTFAADSAEASRSIMFWMLGSLATIHWPVALLGLFTAVLAGAALTALGPQLDAISAGDDVALAVGIRPDRARLAIMLVISLAVGIIVANAGSIGFVGLVVPHFARHLVGARHRLLIPASGLLGAGFLITTDIAARMLFVPQELPIGVVTGVIGAPFLLVLARQRERRPPTAR